MADRNKGASKGPKNSQSGPVQHHHSSNDSGESENSYSAARVDNEDRLGETHQANKSGFKPIERKHTTGPVRRNSGNHKKPKTKNDKSGENRHKRANPVDFTKQSIAELKKVVWPTGEQTSQYFVVVLVFVLFIMAFVAGLDFGFTKLLLWLFS